MPIFSATIANQYLSDLSVYESKARDHSITATEANSARTIVANYYNYLNSVGIKYGAAAFDVSQDVGFFGGVANVLLENGIAVAKPTFNAAQTDLYRDSMMISLAFQDASLRINSSIAPNGVLPYSRIDTYHLAVFNGYNISPAFWGGYALDRFDYVGSYMGLSGYDQSYSVGDKILTYVNAFEAVLGGEITQEGISAFSAFQNLQQAVAEYNLTHVADTSIKHVLWYMNMINSMNNILTSPLGLNVSHTSSSIQMQYAGTKVTFSKSNATDISIDSTGHTKVTLTPEAGSGLTRTVDVSASGVSVNVGGSVRIAGGAGANVGTDSSGNISVTSAPVGGWTQTTTLNQSGVTTQTFAANDNFIDNCKDLVKIA